MIRKGIRLRRFCCEDLSNIENYEQAINSPERWDCHHKLEIELNKSRQELIDLNLYYNRPSNELIFLTHTEHQSMHMKQYHKNHNNGYWTNKHRSEDTKQKIRESLLRRRLQSNVLF